MFQPPSWVRVSDGRLTGAALGSPRPDVSMVERRPRRLRSARRRCSAARFTSGSSSVGTGGNGGGGGGGGGGEGAEKIDPMVSLLWGFEVWFGLWFGSWFAKQVEECSGWLTANI
jgi:hypothetical protein